MSYAYIISKSLDPVFAIFIGAAAAGSRIRREEKEKGRSLGETMEVLKRRIMLAYGGASAAGKA